MRKTFPNLVENDATGTQMGSTSPATILRDIPRALRGRGWLDDDVNDNCCRLLRSFIDLSPLTAPLPTARVDNSQKIVDAALLERLWSFFSASTRKSLTVSLL